MTGAHCLQSCLTVYEFMSKYSLGKVMKCSKYWHVKGILEWFGWVWGSTKVVLWSFLMFKLSWVFICSCQVQI